MINQYNAICHWINNHKHGSMKDFEQALTIIDEYIPEQSNRMRVLRDDAKVWDFFLARLDILDAQEALANESITPKVPDIVPIKKKKAYADVPQGGIYDEILSIEQASQYLKVVIPTIYGYTSKNEIPHFKKGKRLFFKKSELEQWLSEGRKKTNDEIKNDAIEYLNKREK